MASYNENKEHSVSVPRIELRIGCFFFQMRFKLLIFGFKALWLKVCVRFVSLHVEWCSTSPTAFEDTQNVLF